MNAGLINNFHFTIHVSVCSFQGCLEEIMMFSTLYIVLNRSCCNLE